MPLFDDPKNEWEMIANRAVDRRERQNQRGKTVELFDVYGRPKYRPQKAVTDTPEKEPASNSPEDLGFVPYRRREDLTVETESATDEPVSETIPCPSGWDLCHVIDEPWQEVSPGNSAGLFRTNPTEDYPYPVTRAWTVNGEPFALYSGGILHHPEELIVEHPLDGFVLADEPGAAWLQGRLPVEKVTLPPGTALEKWGHRFYPYSGVKNILLACDMKGLCAGTIWAAGIKQIKRFGGMPVIAFPKGGARVLSNIDYRGATIRASDKTWALAKEFVPLEVKREGLK